jgi:hypothetical protein
MTWSLWAEGERGGMGTVIRFPGERRAAQGAGDASDRCESATIMILPVIRIERTGDSPTDGMAPDTNTAAGRKRRRRSSRP